jgi:hypothetical protein
MAPVTAARMSTISGMVQFRTVSDVGATGFEQPPILLGKMEIGIIGGAESGAVPASLEADTLLAFVAREWPRLAPEARLRIVEIVTAAGVEPAVAEGLRVARRSRSATDGSS